MASASRKEGSLHSYFESSSSSEGKKKCSKPRVQSGPLRHNSSSKSSRYSPVSDRRAETSSTVTSQPGAGHQRHQKDASSSTRKGVESTTSASATASARLSTSLDFSEVQGDLFSCPSSSALAHCVSEDLAMGKGVAVLFKKQFGGVGALKAQGVKPGGVAVLERKDRFVYYLVTKKRSFHKPTYESLRSSLEAMKAHCVSNEVKELCMPRIGCGLDKLDWGRVTAMIRSIFGGSEMKITVYYL